MHEGARHLVGHHDFTTFRDSLCQANSPLKTLDALEVCRTGEEVHIRARARSFLHHQVRNMAGTLKLVGLGRWHPEDVARALAARDRRAGGPTAPAAGLCLVEVRYSASAARRRPEQPAGAGAMAGEPVESADSARDGESSVAESLRRRYRADAERFRD